MSEGIIVALIVGGCNVLAQIVARWLSHREHKETAADVRYIKETLNGK